MLWIELLAWHTEGAYRVYNTATICGDVVTHQHEAAC